MGVNLDGHHAHHVVMQAHQAFHFLHRSGRRIGLQEGIVALAVFVDPVGHRFDAPILVLDEFSTIVGQNGAKMFDQALGLCGGEILPRDKDMLVKRHVSDPLLSRRIS